MNDQVTGAGATVLDPVCGMSIDPAKAAGMSRVGGQAYYFCSLGCNSKFDATPEKFGAPRQ